MGRVAVIILPYINLIVGMIFLIITPILAILFLPFVIVFAAISGIFSGISKSLNEFFSGMHTMFVHFTRIVNTALIEMKKQKENK
jgi:hypothetical protein